MWVVRFTRAPPLPLPLRMFFLLRAWVRGVRSHVRHTRAVWGGIGGVRGSRVAREAHARDGGLQEGHTRRVRGVGAL